MGELVVIEWVEMRVIVVEVVGDLLWDFMVILSVWVFDLRENVCDVSFRINFFFVVFINFKE